MTPEIEKKRRELFEAWADAGLLSRCGTEYENPYVESAWNGFNAALDAVEIDLADPGTLSASDSPWEILEHCREAITDTGLGLRIKE